MFLNLKNGSLYEGFREGGLRSGQGFYIEPILGGTLDFPLLLIYNGLWKENQPEGHGEMYFPNGDKYIGNFTKGKITGNGKKISRSKYF